MLLTLFTPTYNRARFLRTLYESILTQPSKDKFEWLIVDDGSTDNSRELILSFIAENKIDINYIFQENQGKMQAHNTALKNARGKWFFCVDSDDKMAENSLGSFYDMTDKYYDDPEIAGILTLKEMSNSPHKNANHMPVPDGFKISLRDLVDKKGFKGEAGVFFKTDVLKNYPFPVIEGETFIPESIVYNKIDKKYKYVVFDIVHQICEYQPDGYTANTQRLQLANPKGVALYLREESVYEKRLVKKIKLLALYCAYALIAGNKRIIRTSTPPRILGLIAFLPGILYSKKLKRELK